MTMRFMRGQYATVPLTC